MATAKFAIERTSTQTEKHDLHHGRSNYRTAGTGREKLPPSPSTPDGELRVPRCGWGYAATSTPELARAAKRRPEALAVHGANWHGYDSRRNVRSRPEFPLRRG